MWKSYTPKINLNRAPIKRRYNDSYVEWRSGIIESLLVCAELKLGCEVDLKIDGWCKYATKREAIKAFNAHFYDSVRAIYGTGWKDLIGFFIKQKNVDKNDFTIVITKK